MAESGTPGTELGPRRQRLGSRVRTRIPKAEFPTPGARSDPRGRVRNPRVRSRTQSPDPRGGRGGEGAPAEGGDPAPARGRTTWRGDPREPPREGRRVPSRGPGPAPPTGPRPRAPTRGGEHVTPGRPRPRPPRAGGRAMWALRASVRRGARLSRAAAGRPSVGAATPLAPWPERSRAAFGLWGPGGPERRGGGWRSCRRSAAGEEAAGPEDAEGDEELLHGDPLLPAGSQRVCVVHPEVKWGPGKPRLTRGDRGRELGGGTPPPVAASPAPRASGTCTVSVAAPWPGQRFQCCRSGDHGRSSTDRSSLWCCASVCAGRRRQAGAPSGAAPAQQPSWTHGSRGRGGPYGEHAEGRRVLQRPRDRGLGPLSGVILDGGDAPCGADRAPRCLGQHPGT